MRISDEMSSVRVDRLFGSIGRGIAQAQHDLARTGIEIARLMAGADLPARIPLGEKHYSMLELGLTPTFYQLADTSIELKVSLSMTSQTATSGGTYATADHSDVATVASSVGAQCAAKYRYSAEGASLMRTKLVPIPAPALFTERVQALVEEHKKLEQTAGDAR